MDHYKCLHHVNECESFIEKNFNATLKRKLLKPFKPIFDSKAGKEIGLDYKACLNAKNSLELDNLFFGRI